MREYDRCRKGRRDNVVMESWGWREGVRGGRERQYIIVVEIGAGGGGRGAGG